MSDDTTSSGTGATPTSETGATPTTTSGSATPPKSTPALEDVLRENDELKRSHTNAKEELERHRKKLTAYEKQEQERATQAQAAKDAELSELERVKKQHQEAEARIKQQQQQLVMAHIKLLASEKGILNAELIAPFVERKLEYDKDGEPTNLEAVLDEIIKGNPNLVKQAEPAPPPAQSATPPAVTTPAIPAMNPGRSSIPGPGGNPIGRVPEWNEVYKRP